MGFPKFEDIKNSLYRVDKRWNNKLTYEENCNRTPLRYELVLNHGFFSGILRVFVEINKKGELKEFSYSVNGIKKMNTHDYSEDGYRELKESVLAEVVFHKNCVDRLINLLCKEDE